jgi:peptide/nickel transport system permease protein
MSIAVESGAPQTTPYQEKEKVAILSVRQIMWSRFKRNRLAMIGAVILTFMYLVALFAGFLAPYGARTTFETYVSAPPYGLRFVDESGEFHLRPFVYRLESVVDPQTFRRSYQPVTDEIYPIRFFAQGVPYRLFGFIPTDRRLFAVEEPGVIFLLGTDRQGRDLFSRILYGSQVSLTVGLIGVLLSLVIGTVLGVATGYFGGIFDSIVQRVIEVLLAFPQIPLWLALAALVPPTWSSIQVFFGISVVLSLVNWGALARQVRGMVYSLREEDYIVAARYTNCSDWYIISRHLIPNTLSHVLVIATLAIPSMILGETALSFLGLGIRPPMTSWGLLLTEAQHVRVLLQQPWLLTPAIFVVVTIISFNFLGDGLRDAADPFADR